MKKEDFLQYEGVTEDVAIKLAEVFNGMIPRDRFNEVNEAKKNAEALVKERDKQIEDLLSLGSANDELKAEISKLQNANAEAQKNYEANIYSMKLDNAIHSALVGANAKNEKAVRSLLNVEGATFEEDGTVKGLAEQIRALSESDGYLFGTQTQSIVGANPISTPAPTPAGITKAEFSRMGYTERSQLYNENPELYSQLSE